MPPYYPAFLDLRAQPCVVVGGGEVAERKVQGLLECEAQVTVISPEATAQIQRWVQDLRVRWEPRRYAPGDLKDAFLVIAATDQEEVNRAVVKEAQRERVLLNVVDVPSMCTFIAPSVIRRGEVTLAISTGGASPALARKLRESLDHSQLLEYADLSPILSQAREEVRRRGIRVHPDRWQSCITDELVALVQAGREAEAHKRLMSGLLEQQGEVE